MEEEKRIAEEKRKAEEKRIAEKKRIAKEELNKKLALIIPETELEKAQNFLGDVEIFVKNNPEEFDILEIMEFIISTKPILDGILDDEQIKNIEIFKEYTDTSSNFVEFQHKNKKLKIEKELEKIDNEINILTNNIQNLKKYMQDNMNSKSISLVLKEIKLSQPVLDNPNTFLELKNANISIEALQTQLNHTEDAIKVANTNIEKLKKYLQDNLGSDLAPTVMEEVKVLNNAISNEILADILRANQRTTNFISQKLESSNKIEKNTNVAGAQTSIVSSEIPAKESKFIQIVNQAKSKLPNAETDFQIGAILAERNNKLISLIVNKNVTNWIGTVHKLDSNSDGKGILSIVIGDKSFYLQTWNNAFSDMFSETLIEFDSSIYNIMSLLKEKDKVKISGSFFVDSEGFLETQNLTKKSKIKKPQFTFKFSNIEKIN